MKIVIAGASGFVGQMLVPALQRRGAELILLGRSVDRLQSLFPGHDFAVYDDFPNLGAGADLFLNLAVINNDKSAGDAEFARVNVDFAAELARQAVQSGAKRFINVNSIHALDYRDNRPYAASKRAGIRAVDAALGGHATHLYLPAVIGDKFAGALSPLNALPKPLARALLGPLAALKPILPVSELVDWLVNDAERAGRHVILTPGQRNNHFYAITKRAFDIGASAFGLIVASPLLVVTWVLIVRQGDGPGIFAQQRIGQKGRTFTCYKFRTMAVGTVQAGTHEVSGSSVTPLGARLRRLKIDELPQLWNVLIGEMSFIGPRPCLPSQQELVERRLAAGVLDVRPGISGLAQVNDIDMSDPAKLVEWDARYIALRGLILDLKLILRTVRGGGRGDRVAE